MQLFLDSVSAEDVARATAWGAIDGVTTNPTLIAKSGQSCRAIVTALVQVTRGPVSVELLAETPERMLQEGIALAAWSPQIVVKLPLTEAGLVATRLLSAAGIKTNLTLCFTAAQGLLAAKAGATYISPFVGRLDDGGERGLDLVEQLASLVRTHGLTAQVLAASMRSVEHVLSAALAGSHVATVSMALLEKMLHHPLTDVGVKAFALDWQKSGQPSLLPEAAE